MAQQIEITIAHPIAKEAIGRLDGCRAAIHCDKTERPDPGLEADLAQSFANPVSSLLPHTVHSLPLLTLDLAPRPAIESHDLGLNYSQPYPQLLISRNSAISIGHWRNCRKPIINSPVARADTIPSDIALIS